MRYSYQAGYQATKALLDKGCRFTAIFATADVMAAQAKNLSDQQIADLAAYYASVPGSLRDLQNAN